ILLVFRVLAHITVPLTPTEQQALNDLFSKNSTSNLSQVLGLLDVFSGGSLQTFSIVALSIYPYITATIVMQLLQPIIPALQNLAMQGESGRLRISQITRIITVPLAFLQAFSSAALFQSQKVLTNFSLIDPQYALQSWAIVMSLTAGVMILVWLGELITENGIGNGISLIIFGGILSRIPSFVNQGYLAATSSGNVANGIISIAVFLLIGLVTIVGIVYIYMGQRRVPVQYPTKRMVGRGMLVGSAQTTYIPMQVNSAGMIPLIFAQSMLLFPSVISQYLTTSPTQWLKDTATWVATYMAPTQWYYWAVYFLLVVLFTYFYAFVMWQQQNIPENLQKQGAFIPGYRPGEPTSRYLENILKRITLAGALFLGIVAVLPFVARVGNANQLLGSASLLIVVGVVLDTVRQLEAQMVMRNYSGFLS
ncbi:MAG: preprotein translocase subunit SecY, partial [Ktedonobacteraceae bacterium]|nr:preprotein translocase subunit SecY [Ktedonobacteraceae bacterium]